MLPAGTDPFLPLQEALKGRYSLVRELGRGGMGIVYLAHEVALDRAVALKVLPPDLAAERGLRERFLREARTAARLSHPNIVPIFAVDQAGLFVFFAMAYVDGETLGQRIRSRGPLPTSDATRVLRDVAWAVGYAHAQGVIHRDLKADNILLENGSGRALVTDFGIAQVRTQTGGSGEREIVGTAEYMSPEQACGEAVDERSDVYSLGVVGYFAASARLPFEGETVSAVLAQHMTQPAPPLASVGPEVSGTLARAVDRCLAKEPGQRFQTAGELASALAESLEVRREMPLPLRAFVQQLRRASQSSAVITVVGLWLTGVLATEIAVGHWGGAALAASGLGLVLGAPLGACLPGARRLLRSGYVHADLVHAVSGDLQRQREELAFQYGRGESKTERIARRITYGGFGLFGLGTVLTILSTPLGNHAALATMIAGGLTTLSAGAIAGHRYQRRKDLTGERWLKLWQSRFGKWLARLAGLGLTRRPGSPAPTYRHTEIAIGMAADRLFEDLPKAARRSLKDLPDTVRRLEAQADKMRRRIALLDAGRMGGGDVLARDIAEARAAAQRRLADSVTALETIRLQLLRMHAGLTTMESLTADLSAAREIADAVDRVLEGNQVVAALLSDPAAGPGRGPRRSS
jgi:eukaryotic-like serine/threonine-protein kinase